MQYIFNMTERDISVNYLFYNYYFLSGALFIVYLIYRIVHSVLISSNSKEAIYRSRGHTWRSIDCNKSVPYNIYCTVCRKLMLPLVGLFCECCAVSACKKCCRFVDRKYKCKVVTWPENKPFFHQWVNVGSVQASVDIPDLGHATEDRLRKFFCSWCHRIKIATEDSVNNNLERCDFQKYKNIIIPPACVQVDKGIVTAIKTLQNKDWEPLIVFANRKAGSYKGDEVLSLFRGVLNPIQVIDISSTRPENVVRWFPPRCRVLAAGGDGTVAWILNALRTVPHTKAAVAILPMGTGNDLSRVLGWGPTCCALLDVDTIIQSVREAEEQPLDTWKVSIKPNRNRLVGGSRERVLYAYNYVSLGVDAQVALDFHRARRAFLYRYANRTLNYIAYAFLGANRAFDDGGCQGLERRLRVQLDDNPPLELPPIQALVLLNIPSWGAGVDLWSMGDEQVGEQSICDGKLEVAGVSSSFHIARLQCGLAEPYRFGQASKVSIELMGSCAMQVDGEPWMQAGSRLTLQPQAQSLVLRARNTNNS